MLKFGSRCFAQDGAFFSHAAALLEEVEPNIEFWGPGGDQADCPKPGGFFFADTGIEVTFRRGLRSFRAR